MPACGYGTRALASAQSSSWGTPSIKPVSLDNAPALSCKKHFDRCECSRKRPGGVSSKPAQAGWLIVRCTSVPSSQAACVSLPAPVTAGLTCLGVNASGTVISGAEDGSIRLSNIDSGRILGSMAGLEHLLHLVLHVWDVSSLRCAMKADMC